LNVARNKKFLLHEDERKVFLGRQEETAPFRIEPNIVSFEEFHS